MATESIEVRLQRIDARLDHTVASLDRTSVTLDRMQEKFSALSEMVEIYGGMVGAVIAELNTHKRNPDAHQDH